MYSSCAVCSGDGRDHVVDASGGTALGRGHRVGAGVIDSGGGTAGAGQAWYATAIGSCHSIAQGTDASGRNAVALGGSHDIAYASSSCAPYAVALGRRCKIASGYGGSSAYAAFTEGSGNRIAMGVEVMPISLLRWGKIILLVPGWGVLPRIPWRLWVGV